MGLERLLWPDGLIARRVLVAVTDHAAERYRQRVRGTLDARTEVAARVGRAWAAGDVSREPPPGAAAQRGSVYVRDGDIVYVCLEDRPRGELVVVTLWEEGEARPPSPRPRSRGRAAADDAGAGSAVPRRLVDYRMGFMDKAKKMAEQAQAKLDEAQKQFNSGQQQGQAPVRPSSTTSTAARSRSQAPPAAPPHGDPLAGHVPGAAARATPGVPPTDPGAPVEAAAPARRPSSSRPCPPTESAPPPAPPPQPARGDARPAGPARAPPRATRPTRTATTRATRRRSSPAGIRSRADRP